MRISDWSSDVCSSDLLVAVVLVAWLGLLGTRIGVERRFIATVWAASALTLGFATRRVWFSVLAATAFYGLIWATSALKFKYLEVPAIAPYLSDRKSTRLNSSH